MTSDFFYEQTSDFTVDELRELATYYLYIRNPKSKLGVQHPRSALYAVRAARDLELDYMVRLELFDKVLDDVYQEQLESGLGKIVDCWSDNFLEVCRPIVEQRLGFKINDSDWVGHYVTPPELMDDTIL